MRIERARNKKRIWETRRMALAFRLLLIPCCLLLVSVCFAQSATATLDRDKILLGEQVTLELKAEGINTQTKPLAAWFSLPDTINHIEVVKRSPIDTIVVNGTTSYIQNVTLTSFDSGDWKLPPLAVLLQNGDNEKDTLTANDLTIEVLPVDVSNLQEYHPIKDIIDVDVTYNYWLIAGVILFILAYIFIVWYFFFRKKEKGPPEIKPVAARSLFETTIDQLEKLKKDNPPAQPFYTKLDEICRLYIQNQLHIRAIQLTSDELMIQLKVYVQPEDRTSFFQLLRLINAVKFARYQPEEAQKATDIETAKSAIEHIYYNLQRNLAQHAK